jgi:phosphoenolpyruvate carboxykinase (GTP)
MTSETTAASKGEVGKVRHDPFAMLPFCGYNMGDYFDHWLHQEKKGRVMPKIFYVNWFLKDNDAFLWPGFFENMRVLKWCFDRAEGREKATKTPIGYIPVSIDTAGLDLPGATMEKLFAIDKTAWKKEIEDLEAYFSRFGAKLPQQLEAELKQLKKNFCES